MTARIVFSLVVLVLYGQCRPATAQRATSPVTSFLGQYVDEFGNPPTDPTTPLYKNIDPLVPVIGSNGEHWTLDDLDDVTGEIRLSARSVGGTDMFVELEGLLPNERFSIWGAYDDPAGERVAFGAVTARGDGSDNVANADADGRISLKLVQLAGPMTVFGNAPAYARASPVLDSNGVPRNHTGYGIGIAYHFPNAPEPPYLNPGPIDTWSMVAVASFTPIPEPSSIVLSVLSASACAVCGLRRRGKHRSPTIARAI